jgi:hypothetical protein
MTESKFAWPPLIRKFETLVFAALLIVIPFFAYRIVDTAGTALMVQNTAVDLVKDLRKAKDIARDFHLNVTVTSAPPTMNEPSSYLIQSGPKTIEQVILPNGVSIAGSITFNDGGLPLTPSSFIIAKGGRTASVQVNREGSMSNE